MADIVTRAREIVRLTGREHNGPRHSPLAETGGRVSGRLSTFDRLTAQAGGAG